LTANHLTPSTLARGFLNIKPHAITIYVTISINTSFLHSITHYIFRQNKDSLKTRTYIGVTYNTLMLLIDAGSSCYTANTSNTSN